MHGPRYTRFCCVLAVSTLSFLGASTLSAEALCEDDKPDLGREAEEHFVRGKTLSKAGDIKGAYLEYKAAFELKQSYDIAANLGNVELELGMPRDAAQHLAFAIRNAAVTVKPDQIERLNKVFSKAKKIVGSVFVKVNIAGAEIRIDGEPMGRSPLNEELFVDPGPHTVEARLSPYEPAKQLVECPRNSPQMISLTLTLPAFAAQPLPSSQLPVVKPPPPLLKPQPLPSSKSLWPIVIGAGVTAVGLGIGLGSTLAESGESRAIERLKSELGARDVRNDYSVCSRAPVPAECAQLDRAYIARGSFSTLSAMSFAVAGVAALTTITYALIPGPKPIQRRGARAAFGASPNGFGFHLLGEF